MNTERHNLVLGALRSWGHLSPEAIAEAIEVALSWEPAPPSGVVPDRWGCGCDTRECNFRRDQLQDSGVDPHAIVRFTCIHHGLVGSSHSGRVRDGLSRLEAQAMLNLDLAHQKQCR